MLQATQLDHHYLTEKTGPKNMTRWEQEEGMELLFRNQPWLTITHKERFAPTSLELLKDHSDK